MGRCRAYPEYKDSGIAWIGVVPSDWDVLKIKHLLKSEKGAIKTGPFGSHLKGDDMKGSEYKVINQRSVIDNDFESGEFFVSKKKYDELIGFRVFPDDILITTRGTIGRTAVAPIGLKDSILHPCLMRLQIDQNRYINDLVSLIIQESGYFLEELKILSNATTIDVIYSENLKNVAIALPRTIEEQVAIANFLDHETAKIDTLIEKQQQLIKLLKEKRQAVISHAVTKGINPDAPMRDSGVEWLGEVPAHWVVTKVKYLFDFVTSGSRGWAEYYSDKGALFFRIANLTRDTIEPKLESIQNVSPPVGSEGERSIIKKSDLLISITADLGSVCVANEDLVDGYVSQHVALCRPNRSVKSSRWLGYFILSDQAKEQFIGSGYGGTKIQLSLEDIREIDAAKPPANEQIDIERHIDERLVKFSKLIGRAEDQIHLLHERRTALISAAVTGKIDVRDWTAPAPQTNKEDAA